ncbi:MAG: polysaccharide deacetylase family protein [Proteobacteria bacterium]|nr:polysaccharide deacetylase family protein [Pseudomonadota bacterium]
MSRRFEKILSPLLYATGIHQRGWRRLAREGGATLVVCYHRIREGTGRKGAGQTVSEGVPAETFEAQLRFLLEHFDPVAPSAVSQPFAGKRLRFAITFDDGYLDNLSVAAPILQRLGVPAAFYVVSNYVGTTRRFWWDRVGAILAHSAAPRLDINGLFPAGAGHELPPSLPLDSPAARQASGAALEAALRASHPRDVDGVLDRLARRLEVTIPPADPADRLMNWAEIRRLSELGFEIGGHSADHFNLARLSGDELDEQIAGCKARIEQETGKPVLSFAYPYGGAQHCSPAVFEATRRAGIPVAFTAQDGVATPSDNSVALSRLCLNWPWPFACAHNIAQALAAAPAA